ncbi:hypothetical protein FB451DRAFT_1175539 [Mycena latifolia]|nr:hypothetical protein FB451DRAFT_1175539 [Mycena latifolia]
MTPRSIQIWFQNRRASEKWKASKFPVALVTKDINHPSPRLISSPHRAAHRTGNPAGSIPGPFPSPGFSFGANPGSVSRLQEDGDLNSSWKRLGIPKLLCDVK